MHFNTFELDEWTMERLEEQFRAIIESPQLRRWVTYKSKGARTAVTTSSTASFTSTDNEVACYMTRTSIDKKRKEIYQDGEHIYHVIGQELEGRGVDPKTDDFIVDGTQTLEILGIETGPQNTFYAFVVKGR
jgi:hypothetical protein